MSVLKHCLDLLREAAAAAAAAAGQSWAAADGLGVLAAVPRAHGVGGPLARLLRCCAPARTDLAPLEGVRADTQRSLLVRNAAGELVSVLRCAEQLERLEQLLPPCGVDFGALKAQLLEPPARGDDDCEEGDEESLPT